MQIVSFSMAEADVHTVMRHPGFMVGTDGEAFAKVGPMRKGKPHPRAYGTFPRILGKYVREEKVLSLAAAIRKMTALPARRLGLVDRGADRRGLLGRHHGLRRGRHPGPGHLQRSSPVSHRH